ncbi:MAG: glutamate racemase, partial [Planctomycetota bacterium]
RQQAAIKLFPCEGLVDIIEKDHNNTRAIYEYLSGVFSGIERKGVSAVVLGCTHYVLIKKEIAQALGGEIRIIDGNYGTARRLKTVLQNERLLNGTVHEAHPVSAKPKVKFCMSGSEREVVAKYKQWLLAAGIVCESEFMCCR